MPITIDGTGSITGLSAGGLPDGSVTTADLAAGAVTAPKLDGAQPGSAPVYAARAWVNFNGTGTVAIRASGNVSSITDSGTGAYVINLTNSLLNADYSAVLGWSTGGATYSDDTYEIGNVTIRGRSSSSLTLAARDDGGAARDVLDINAVFFL